MYRLLGVVDADALSRPDRRRVRGRAGEEVQPAGGAGQVKAVLGPGEVQPPAQLAGAVEEVLTLVGGQPKVKSKLQKSSINFPDL